MAQAHATPNCTCEHPDCGAQFHFERPRPRCVTCNKVLCKEHRRIGVVGLKRSQISLEAHQRNFGDLVGAYFCMEHAPALSTLDLEMNGH
jgi:hypothetical protein